MCPKLGRTLRTSFQRLKSLYFGVWKRETLEQQVRSATSSYWYILSFPFQCCQCWSFSLLRNTSSKKIQFSCRFWPSSYTYHQSSLWNRAQLFISFHRRDQFTCKTLNSKTPKSDNSSRPWSKSRIFHASDSAWHAWSSTQFQVCLQKRRRKNFRCKTLKNWTFWRVEKTYLQTYHKSTKCKKWYSKHHWHHIAQTTLLNWTNQNI